MEISEYTAYSTLDSAGRNGGGVPIRELKEVVHRIVREYGAYLASDRSVERRDASTVAIGWLIGSLKRYERNGGIYRGRVVCVLPNVADTVLIKVRYQHERNESGGLNEAVLHLVLSEALEVEGEVSVASVDRCELLCGSKALIESSAATLAIQDDPIQYEVVDVDEFLRYAMEGKGMTPITEEEGERELPMADSPIATVPEQIVTGGGTSQPWGYVHPYNPGSPTTSHYLAARSGLVSSMGSPSSWSRSTAVPSRLTALSSTTTREELASWRDEDEYSATDCTQAASEGD